MKERKELWKDIAGWEGQYQISTLGRVKSLERFTETKNKMGTPLKLKVNERVLKSNTNNCNYLWVRLSDKNKGRIRYYLHHLVARAFIPNTYNKKYINHLDCDKNNNSVDNLEWCTAKENVRHYHKDQQLFAVIDLKNNNNTIAVLKHLRDAAELCDVQPSTVWQILKGKFKTAGKKRYTFQYIN